MKEIEAAPPDAGGHRGVSSTPDEVLARPDSNSPRAAPYLPQLDPEPRGRGAYTEIAWAFGLACLIAAFVVTAAVWW